MINRYDILALPPLLNPRKLPKVRQQLAQALILSGRMRIDAGDVRNFVRYRLPQTEIEIVLSARELTDAALQTQTRTILLAGLSKFGAQKAEAMAQEAVKAMRERLPRSPLPETTETALACALVQAAEPAVIALALAQRIEIYISFGFEVGDVMNTWDWQQHGKNSGMQSTEQKTFAVYVSCGGNPFAGDDEKTYATDGFQALARMMIVASQELGHFADIKRDAGGKPVGRVSAQLWPLRPSPECKRARDADIAQLEHLTRTLEQIGLARLAWHEQRRALLKQHHVRGLLPLWLALYCWLRRQWIVMRCARRGIGWLSHLPRNTGWATHIEQMLPDMRFNLTPKADVYARADPREEEAIACIEALARVPQQRLKWGDAAARGCMGELYKLYYGTVIPACEQSVRGLIRKG